jgi:hypothetical protein
MFLLRALKTAAETPAMQPGRIVPVACLCIAVLAVGTEFTSRSSAVPERFCAQSDKKQPKDNKVELPEGSKEFKDDTFAKWLKDYKLYALVLKDKDHRVPNRALKASERRAYGTPRLISVVDPKGDVAVLEPLEDQPQLGQGRQKKQLEKAIVALFRKANLKATADGEVRDLTYIVLLLVRLQYPMMDSGNELLAKDQRYANVPAQPLNKDGYKVRKSDGVYSVSDVLIVLHDGIYKVSVQFDDQGRLDNVELEDAGAFF